MEKDRWRELCRLVEDDDGLPTRESGPWALEKLKLWHTYVDITTRAMSGNRSFPGGLVYLDLFAGPGICHLRESKERIPGSPLIAAHALKPFTKVLLCEMDRVLADACMSRLNRTDAAGRTRMFIGDCNEQVTDMVRQIPERSLTPAFIDPTGLHAYFETIATLANARRVDLLVLFADACDAVRNLQTYYDQGGSNLDRVLGPDSGWRERFDALEVRESRPIRNMLSDVYTSQLKRLLGYTFFGSRVVRCPRGALYRLIYASKHELGEKFWQVSDKEDAHGQGQFW